MKRWSVPLFVAILLLLVIPAKAGYDRYQQAIGRRDAELAILRPKAASLFEKAHRLEMELGKKVRVAYRTKMIWDTLPPLIPDLLKPDAEPVPASVLANVIFIGQEAVESCHSALSPCLVLNAIKDTIITNQQRQISILEKRVPGRWDGAIEWGFRGLAFWLGTKAR